MAKQLFASMIQMSDDGVMRMEFERTIVNMKELVEI